MVYRESITCKVIQAVKQGLKGISARRKEATRSPENDAISSSLLIGCVAGLREILCPGIHAAWRSSHLRSLLASFGRDFNDRPIPLLSLFFSSCLLFHTLWVLDQSWTPGKIVAKGLLVFLPLLGLRVKVDLKGLLGSSLISKAWAITSRFSDGPSATPPKPGLSKPLLSLRKDTR